MIASETVFILGAGAHVSYGFPVGNKLKSDIVSLVTPNESRASNKDDFWIAAGRRDSDIKFASCKEFSMALCNAGQPSIDAFLNSNRHKNGYEAIGKAAIAKILLDYEKGANFGGEDDWMEYVFRIMLEGVDSLHDFSTNNKVAFITFNYDRFLERFLHSRIASSFGVSENEAYSYLERIPVYHVYGSIGNYSINCEIETNDWIRLGQEIKTIFDGVHDSALIEKAKGLVEKAEKVCLLGFGFHQENIQLLELPRISSLEHKSLYCTRYGLTDAEWDRLTRPFNGANFNPSNEYWKCLQALRHFPIF
jgi:hypothetical protein